MRPGYVSPDSLSMRQRAQLLKFRSSIPSGAVERVTRTEPGLRDVECRVGLRVVGRRVYGEEGRQLDEPLERGRPHGRRYELSDGGFWFETFTRGMQHGLGAHVIDGELAGAFRFVRGEGWDLYWHTIYSNGRRSTPVYLSEARFLRDRKLDGFEWWLNEDQRSVWEENHFVGGERHGISRRWATSRRRNLEDRVFWLHDERVTRRAYDRAAKSDPRLPPCRPEDDSPERTFPAAIAGALRPPRRR